MNKEIYYIWLSEHHQGHDISEEKAAEYYKIAQDLSIKIVHIESEAYPDSLRLIDEPPLILYCYGDISLLKSANVAIVGTRRASPYGKWVTRSIGKILAKNSWVHVSGMAEGIDAEGHRAVLENGGKSIAVLGTGLDICYPRSSRDIYENLMENGLIISEYAPGTSGFPSNFPRRNRLISGLVENVVIIEGSLHSGSMITARLALDQGKNIFAVPGNINQINSLAPNTLISDGAIPIIDLDYFAESLNQQR